MKCLSGRYKALDSHTALSKKLNKSRNRQRELSEIYMDPAGRGNRLDLLRKLGGGGRRVDGEREGTEEENMRERECSKRGKDKEAKKGKIS